MSNLKDLLNKKEASTEATKQDAMAEMAAASAKASDGTIEVGTLSASTTPTQLSVGQVASGVNIAITLADVILEALPMFTYLLGRIKAIFLANGTKKVADANGLITAETEEEKQILAHLEKQNAGYAVRVDKHTEQA